MVLRIFGVKGSVTQSVNYLINYKAVCRTAPTTPGLLIIVRHHMMTCYNCENLLFQNQKKYFIGFFIYMYDMYDFYMSNEVIKNTILQQSDFI